MPELLNLTTDLMTRRAATLEDALALLVLPPQDARTGRRQRAAREISRCAQRLAAERGYDEFTLDDLAHAAGVSRRTLFNYFPGKEQAVIGPAPGLEQEAIDEFLAGGPTGHLMSDVAVLAIDLVEDAGGNRQDWRLSRRCFERNPRLLVAAMEHFHELAGAAQQVIGKREGVPPTSRRARVTVGIMAALFDLSINEFVESADDRPVADIFRENLTLVGTLMRGLTSAPIEERGN